MTALMYEYNGMLLPHSNTNGLPWFLRNERYSDSRPVPVPDVIHAEEADEQGFFFYRWIDR